MVEAATAAADPVTTEAAVCVVVHIVRKPHILLPRNTATALKTLAHTKCFDIVLFVGETQR